ncbi:MAG: hypothetical protein JNK25_00985 [Phycisphaerae bacterium]|nr:hypothetical protein [Phycisphaerae bacterium]
MMTRRTVVGIVTPALLAALASAQPINSTRTTSGLWGDPSGWSSSPNIPNNGQPDLLDEYFVTIANKQVELDQDITISKLTLGHGSGLNNSLTNITSTHHTLVVTQQFDLTHGNLGGNVTYKVGPGGVMNFLALPFGFTRQLNAVLENRGDVNVQFLTTLICGTENVAFHNMPGADLLIQNGCTFSRLTSCTNPVLENHAGATIVNDTTQSTNIQWTVNNHGTINVQRGSMNLGRGGTHSGVFETASGRTITFSGSGFGHTFTENSVIGGAGTASFTTDAEIFTLPENLTIERINIAGPGDVNFVQLADEHTINIVEQSNGKVGGNGLEVQSFNWLGGEVATDMLTVNQFGNATNTFSGLPPRQLKTMLKNNGVFNARNTITADSTDRPAGIENHGSFKTQGQTSIAGDGSFVNAGLFEVTQGPATMELTYRGLDGATVRVRNVQELVMNVANELRGGLGLDDQARINMVLQNGDLLNAVAVQLAMANGQVNFVNVADAIFDAASTIEGTGRIDFGPSEQFEMDLVNFGITKPGNSPGTLTIGASFRLGESSVLDYEFGVPGGPADLIVVDGHLTLDGRIDVTELEGFDAGEHVIFTYAGDLIDHGLEVGQMPEGFTAEVVIDTVARRVLLVVTGDSACVADFNEDGGIDGADVEAFFAAWESQSDPRADVNQDGGIDGADVEAFFSQWENQCSE